MVAGILIFACWTGLVVYWNLRARSTKPAAERQSPASRLARLPVWLGFLLLAAAWVPPVDLVVMRRTVLSDSIGVTVCAAGLLLAIWSRRTLGDEWSQDVEVKRGHRLVQGGPYRLMRHPIYSAHLLMGLGTAIASASLTGFVGLASFLLGFWIKLRQEEELLLRSFPDEYASYRRSVKALLPYLL